MDSLVPKSDFFGLEEVAHLGAGGETPFLKRHLEAIRWFAEHKSAGMSGREQVLERRASAREKLAGLLGCEADEIGFPLNVAQAANMVARSLDLRPGDNVVMERWEFPSLLNPWLRWRERGLEVRLLAPEAGGFRVPLERVRAAVDGRTRALALSQVSYYTGERHDLAAYAEIAHAVGAALVVDATQALGAVPVHAPHADFLFSSCYKWILGIHGVAVAYCNRARQPEWQPKELGSASMEWQDARERGGTVAPVRDGRRFELSNPSLAALCVLEGGLDYLLPVGMGRIEQHVLALSGDLRRRLVGLGLEVLTPEPAAERAGNVVFAVQDTARWRRGLEAHGVLAWESEGRVRLSPHVYNDTADLERAEEAVAAILRDGGA